MVYKRAEAETYSYDFQYKGLRFSGNTGKTTKREAEAFEKQQREIAAQRYRQRQTSPKGEMRFDEAVERFWDEVAVTHKNAHITLATLEWLQEQIGPGTYVSAISDALIADLIVKRRARRNKGAPGHNSRPLSPATINRTVVQPLRHIHHRARDVWKIRVGEVRWAGHLLKEPKERVREASQAEEAAILLALGHGYDVLAEFAFYSGCRRMELINLRWQDIDLHGGRFVVVGKNNKPRTIPISTHLRELLESCEGHHTTHVFTFVARRTDKRKQVVKGKRYPITEEGMKTAFRRAVPKSGVKNFRFHDTRHTMATRTLRQSNIRVVQQLLGHEDVTTTAKYAHAVLEDVHAAMEAASPTKGPTALDEGSEKTFSFQGKTR